MNYDMGANWMFLGSCVDTAHSPRKAGYLGKGKLSLPSVPNAPRLSRHSVHAPYFVVPVHVVDINVMEDPTV